MFFIHFILGLAPILWLIFALTALKMPTYKAAFGSLLLSVVLAIGIWKMNPMHAVTAAFEGFLMALWPIILVIIAAVFTYNLSLRTKGIDIIKQMITSVTSDKRILVLLIAWCFGGFMEGMAGFGTAIAIPAGMLITLGFDPIFSCLVCLIANGAPTPFGSIGIPTVTLANLVGLDNPALAFTTSCQLAFFMILIPFLIVMISSKGLKNMKGLWGITFASGVSFIVPQLIISYFVGAELAVVVGSVCSLFVTVLLGKKIPANPAFSIEIKKKEIKPIEAFKACSPFIFIFIFLLSTSKLVTPVHTFLSQFSSTVTIYTGKNPGSLTFSWINTPGIWIFLSAILGAIIQKATFNDFKIVFIETVKQMSETILTMLCVLGCAKIMGYSGMIRSIASFAIAITGSFYPFFAPWIGALGTFVTGSGTSSGVLFGAVQQSAANSLHTDPLWMVSLNSLGVAAGKMLSPQSIAIALSSVNKKGEDATLLKQIMPYGLGFLILMSCIAYFGSFIF